VDGFGVPGSPGSPAGRARSAARSRKTLKDRGWAAVIPNIEPDLEKILEEGRRFPGKSKTIRGEPSTATRTVRRAGMKTGNFARYAQDTLFPKDGMWRQHSWVYTNDGVVVETTEKRVQYFGFIMTEEECEIFWERNF
jgi:hypothetical protein